MLWHVTNRTRIKGHNRYHFVGCSESWSWAAILAALATSSCLAVRFASAIYTMYRIVIKFAYCSLILYRVWLSQYQSVLNQIDLYQMIVDYISLHDLKMFDHCYVADWITMSIVFLKTCSSLRKHVASWIQILLFA